MMKKITDELHELPLTQPLIALGHGSENRVASSPRLEEKETWNVAMEVIAINAVLFDAVEKMKQFFEKRIPMWKEK